MRTHTFLTTHLTALGAVVLAALVLAALVFGPDLLIFAQGGASDAEQAEAWLFRPFRFWWLRDWGGVMA